MSHDDNYHRTIKTPSTKDLILRMQRTGLHRNAELVRLTNFLEIDPTDTDLRDLLIEKLEGEESKQLLLQDHFRSTSPICQNEFRGEILLGSISPTGLTWRVPAEQFVCGTLIAGRPGGGKSNLIFLILTQLLGEL